MLTAAPLILGIDPGSRVMGYGALRQEKGDWRYADCGTVRVKANSLTDRIAFIYQGMTQLLQRFQPDCVAIEKVFVALNAHSALVLGHVRGATLAAVAQQALPVHEYSARQVKKAIAGYGAADKVQMQTMVMRLLGLAKAPSADAADALAIALCHANSIVSQRLQQRAYQRAME